MGSILMDRGDRFSWTGEDEGRQGQKKGAFAQRLLHSLPINRTPLLRTLFLLPGDAHPSQATALAAFHRPDIVFNNLNRSKADCQGIATYCLYFVLSVSDYFEASGDAAGVAYLTPNVQDHLEQAAAMWKDPEGLRFAGWDDRLGSGFANNTTPETQALYRLLAIRAWKAAAQFLANNLAH